MVPACKPVNCKDLNRNMLCRITVFCVFLFCLCLGFLFCLGVHGCEEVVYGCLEDEFVDHVPPLGG